MSQKKQRCVVCSKRKPLSNFHKDNAKPSGHRSTCKDCQAERDRERRATSDHAPLKSEDFDVSPANDGRIDPKAASEKRQDFSTQMADFHNALRSGSLTQDNAAYIATLAEQERRFGNRRIARSISLSQAHEALHIAQLKTFADEYLKDKITPSGYAKRDHHKPIKRAACLLLSDLHLGSDLSSTDNPHVFGAKEEARGLDFLLRQTIDFKPQYRDNTELVLMLNGDVIEGFLGHDLRDGAPLAEQKIVFWQYMRTFVAYCSAEFPRVRVECQPGNHGRDKMRHPGRATSSKWDSHEWSLYYGLSMMCRELVNVTFYTPRQAVSLVSLFDKTLLLTHGDTEVKLGDPDTQAARNFTIVDRINSTNLYGKRIDAIAVGHFHKPRFQPRNPALIFNGALVPPNGYARGEGYFGEPCGQWLWESVEGRAVGDMRFLDIPPTGEPQIIKPFRL